MPKPIAPLKDGEIAFAFPDVCNTPSGTSDIPLPYPNIADLNKTNLKDENFITKSDNCELVIGQEGYFVILEGAEFKKSTGDEAGSGGGVRNGGKGPAGPCRIIESSKNVFYGNPKKGIVRYLDKTVQNDENADGFVLSSFPSVLVGD